ncbi:MAG: GntR family transcriptional regulator [Lachnospiraceae bacterium]|nr:GntR family transcriptional regulator [Lachnospiraceae bacterium]
MIWIDYTDATPIYEQIVSKYKNLIVKGALMPNEKMPSVRNLAMDLSINPNTIQKAYAELERQGFIYTVKGRGNFVADNAGLKDVKAREILQKLDAVIKEAEESGVELSVLREHLEKSVKEGGQRT